MRLGARARRVWTAAILAAGWLVARLAGEAAAQYPGGEPPPTVGGRRFFPDPEGGTAQTGSNVLRFIAIALIAIALGLALRRLARGPAPNER